RTRVPPLSMSSALEKELRAASGGLPVTEIRTLEETVSRSTAAQDFNTLIRTLFGFSALVLAAIGIYGLMAWSVSQRIHEIGIRLALGAEAGSIRRMVVREGLFPAVAGVVCGVAAAFTFARSMSGLLFGVQPRDPVAFLMVPPILLTVALLAVWLPARRASRVEPLEALRCE